MNRPNRRSATERSTPVAPEPRPRARLFDLPRLKDTTPGVRTRLLAAIGIAAGWVVFTFWASTVWFSALADHVGLMLAIFLLGGLAIVPGAMNMFVAASLVLDKRPPRRALARYPGVTVLIFVRNQAQSVMETIESIRQQEYPGPFEVIVIDDASTDQSAQTVAQLRYRWVKVLKQSKNRGKAAALNRGLEMAQHELIVTIDADSLLFGDALWSLVEHYVAGGGDMRAVSGCVLVRNSRANWLTRAQEWDFFHGLASMKRMQSLYQGTVIAEGAFSIFDREALREVGGWRTDVAEDIVMTWDFLQRGWRVGFAEDACCFAIVPSDITSFVQQRMRGARATLRALREFPTELLQKRGSTLFVIWHLLFPWTDLAFTLGFLPGIVVAAAYSSYLLVGPLALALLPAVLLMNMMIFFAMRSMFADQGLRIRRNLGGFLIYTFGYGLLLQPARVLGYASELLRRTPSPK
jgi:poly-beta-1,6-N-acetyl-D-glucosamine synthase